jgi:putative chitobiose transport system permease protein
MKKTIIFAALILLLLLSLGPLAWILYSSVTDFNGHLTIANYAGAWHDANISRYMLNSVIVTGMTVFLSLLFCALFAYPMAVLEFKGKKLLYFILLATFFVPWEMTFVPLFSVCVKLGLDNSLWGVILPSCVSAMGIVFLMDAYTSIPKSLFESARIDGLSEWGIWLKVALPLIRPSMAGLAIITFVTSWSLFMWPLIILRQSDSYTLTVGLSYLSGLFSANLKYLAAGSVIACLPSVALFLALQKHFISGLVKGAVKG